MGSQGARSHESITSAFHFGSNQTRWRGSRKLFGSWPCSLVWGSLFSQPDFSRHSVCFSSTSCTCRGMNPVLDCRAPMISRQVKSQASISSHSLLHFFADLVLLGFQSLKQVRKKEEKNTKPAPTRPSQSCLSWLLPLGALQQRPWPLNCSTRKGEVAPITPNHGQSRPVHCQSRLTCAIW